MNKLYPLKFRPLFKQKVWGGKKLHALLDETVTAAEGIGEAWTLSGLEKDMSVVSNGFLQGNSLQELIEIYMGDLLGEKVFGRFGIGFPLLFKFIDTADRLSLQVHPDDKTAREQHKDSGKNELWYVMDAEADAEIMTGFKKDADEASVLHHLQHKTLASLLNVERPRKGDVFSIPAGRVHALGAGITLCEIQQASDLTYRLYDWDRPGDTDNPRELHIEQALKVIDYKARLPYKTDYTIVPNGSVNILKSPHFTVNLLAFDQKLETDFFFLDSFVVYVCVEGSCQLHYQGGSESISKGETVLLPAEIKALQLIPEGSCRLLEVYLS
jgi:mannose-6-phosphate isomerase